MMEETILEGTEEVSAPLTEETSAEMPTATEPGAEAMSEENVDYAALARADLSELKADCPTLATASSLAELPDPVRYAELRDLGLSPREAYLATGGSAKRASDNRAHLFSAVPRTSARGRDLPSTEQMAEARRLFSDLGDEEIYRLYKKVSN